MTTTPPANQLADTNLLADHYRDALQQLVTEVVAHLRTAPLADHERHQHLERALSLARHRLEASVRPPEPPQDMSHERPRPEGVVLRLTRPMYDALVRDHGNGDYLLAWEDNRELYPSLAVALARLAALAHAESADELFTLPPDEFTDEAGDWLGYQVGPVNHSGTRRSAPTRLREISRRWYVKTNAGAPFFADPSDVPLMRTLLDGYDHPDESPPRERREPTLREAIYGRLRLRGGSPMGPDEAASVAVKAVEDFNAGTLEVCGCGWYAVLCQHRRNLWSPA